MHFFSQSHIFLFYQRKKHFKQKKPWSLHRYMYTSSDNAYKFSDHFINYTLQNILLRGPIWLKTCLEIISSKGTKTDGVKRSFDFKNTTFSCFSSALAEKKMILRYAEGTK